MKDKFCFALWYGPQYNFAYGICTKQQFYIQWLEKKGICDGKYTNLNDMFWSVAKHQGWDNIEGLAMTIISDEMFEDTMRIKHKNQKQANEITNRLET